MFPPEEDADWVRFTPEARSTAEPWCSALSHHAGAEREQGEHRGEDRPGVAPCEHHPPEHEHLTIGISRIPIISKKFVSPVGFSKGTAEFEL